MWSRRVYLVVPCGSSPSCAVAHCCSVPPVLYSRLESPCVPSQFLMTGLSCAHFKVARLEHASIAFCTLCSAVTPSAEPGL